MALTKVSYAITNGSPVNVFDYGADPTGAADSTAAITNAIAYVNSLTPGTWKTFGVIS